jgi:hypothetical protein
MIGSVSEKMEAWKLYVLTEDKLDDITRSHKKWLL